MNPKLLLLSPVVPYPPTDGGKLRTFKLCNILADKYDITIIARVISDDLQFEEFLDNEFFSRVHFIPVIYRGDTPSLVAKKPSIGKMIKNKLCDWIDISQAMPYGLDFAIEQRFKSALDECLKKHEFDIVHAEHLHMGQYLKNIKAIPKTLTEMDVEYKKAKQSMKYSRIDSKGKWITRQIDKVVIPLKTRFQLQMIKDFESSLSEMCDVCIAMSEYDKEVLQSMNPNLRIEVVPNGVDISYFQPLQSKSNEPTITYTGHMGYFPNEDAIIFFYKKIFPHIKARFPNVQLNVIGKDPAESIVRLSKSDSNVKVTGLVNDVRPFMVKDNVYIVPLRVGSGTRLKILEAMAMQMAIVSTSIGCQGLDIEHGKHIEIADNPIEFARSVIQLIDNPEKRRQMGEEGRKLVERSYDWRKIAEIQDEVYRRLISDKQS